jgi:hypothetical protein
MELPAAGRRGDPPPWPLPGRVTKAAEFYWGRLWGRPQAVQWERNSQEMEVALLVRSILVAEGPKGTASDRTLVQRKMNDLGLTVPGLRANRWRIVDEVAATGPVERPSGRPSAQARLAKLGGSVVEGGAPS